MPLFTLLSPYFAWPRFLKHQFSSSKPKSATSGVFRFLLLIVFSTFLHDSLLAQWPNPNPIPSNWPPSGYKGVSGCSNCVAQDIKFVNAYLTDYPPGNCTSDLTLKKVKSNITVEIDVTANTRYGFIIGAILYQDEVAKDTFLYFTSTNASLPKGPKTLNFTGADSVTFTPGTSTLELRNLFFAWNNNVSDTLVSSSYKSDSTIDCSLFSGKNGVPPHCFYRSNFAIKTPAQPEITLDLVKTDSVVNCPGGSDGKIFVSVSPNQSAYYSTVYTWTKDGVFYSNQVDSIKNLRGGVYRLVVNVEGCTDSIRVTVTEPPAFSALTNKRDLNCFKDSSGKAWIYSATGGTPYQRLDTSRYKFLWVPNVTHNYGTNRISDTATKLAAGTYTVQLMDSLGCLSPIYTIVLTQPDSLRLVFTKVNDCLRNGSGSATATARGGTAPYSHRWSTGASSSDSISTVTGLAGNNWYRDTLRDSKGCQLIDSVQILKPPTAVLLLGKDSANIACKGGADGYAQVTPTGGKTPYTYLWSNGSTTARISNLLPGNYSVTVKDSLLCTATASFQLKEPAVALVLAVDSSKARLKCPGDSTGLLVAAGSGGTPYKIGAPYRYSWDYKSTTTDSLKKLPAGTYTVTLTDSAGCSISKTVKVTQPPAFDVSFTVTKVNCFGDSTGSVVAKATGGTGTLKYSWNTIPVQNSDTARKLAVGTYTVTVTDSLGCTYQKSVQVTKIAELKADTSKMNVKCFGDSTGSATVLVSGGTPKASGYLYSWSTNPVQTTATATKLLAGKYTVTITDSLGCTLAVSISVSQPAALKTSIARTNVCSEVLKGTATVTPSGGTSPYSYSWATSPVQTSATATNLSDGTYRVTVTDINLCKTTDSVTILKPASYLSATTTSVNVKCYGESTGAATVTASGGIAPYKYSWNTSPVQTTASISGLKAGTYTVTITDSFQCVITKTVTIGQPSGPIMLSADVDMPIICIDETTTIRVNASGGTAPYSFQLNTGTFQKGVESYKNLGPGTYIITVKDSLNCTKSISVKITDKGCYNFCTYTMSYFGTDNNVMANFNQGDGCEKATTRGTIEAALAEWASRGADLKVGNINVSKLSNPVEAILKYLPCGGPSLRYTGTTLDQQTPNNTLLSQTLTLGLNLGLNEKLDAFLLKNDNIITQRYSGECSDGSPLPGNCKNIKFDQQFKGKKVGEIFAAASTALVSGTPEERSSLANMVRTINEAFDKCAMAVMICPSPNLNVTEYEELGTRGIVVRSYPNPFTDHVYLQFVSPIDGEAVFEIFDFNGRKLQELRRPGVIAYQDNLIKYMVPRINNRQIMYRISIGPYKANGVLLSPGK